MQLEFEINPSTPVKKIGLFVWNDNNDNAHAGDEFLVTLRGQKNFN